MHRTNRRCDSPAITAIRLRSHASNVQASAKPTRCIPTRCILICYYWVVQMCQHPLVNVTDQQSASRSKTSVFIKSRQTADRFCLRQLSILGICE